MGFSDQAVGFYLQAENQLSPTIAEASSDYDKFVGQIEKANKRLYLTASKGLDRMADLVDSIASMPQEASNKYDAAIGKLQKKLKPVSQPINLVFTTQSQKSLRKAIGESVVRALSGARLRLGAVFPERRLGYYDTSASLRALYANLVQPPDMKGRLEPKKFSQGGIADGPQKGVDSVFALLEPGELVVPKDLTDKLLAMAEGEFANASQMGETMANIENLATALGKLKLAMEAGLGTKSDLKLYEQGVEALASETKMLSEQTINLGTNTKLRLMPAIKDSTTRLDEFTESGERSSNVFETLLTRILGPARFLALSKAVEDVSQAVGSLSQGATGAFDVLGGDEVEGFRTNVLQLGRALDLTREGMLELKKDAARTSVNLNANLNLMGESMEGLANAGVTSREQLVPWGGLIALATERMDASPDSLANAVYRLGDGFGFADEQIAAVLQDVGTFASVSALQGEAAVQSLTDTIQSAGPALERMTTEQRRTFLTNMVRMSAALEDNWAGSTDAIQGLLARAIGGETDAMISAQRIFNKSRDELEQTFISGDLTGLLGSLSGEIQSLVSTNNIQGLEVLRDALGFEGDINQFQKLGTEVDDINAKLVEMGARQTDVHGLEGAIAALGDTAQSKRSFFDEFRVSFTHMAEQIQIGGVSLLDGVTLMKEFGAESLIAAGYLTKLTVQGIAGLAQLGPMKKMFGSLGGLIGMGGKAGGATKALSTVTTTAGTAGKAAASGGMFASIGAGLGSLAAGLTTFGAAMIGPGGIGLAALVLGLIGIAGAARIAAPVFEIMGDVLMHMVDGFVQMFKHALDADPTNLLILGPAMMAGAVGVTSMAAAVGLYGAAMLTASAGVAAFTLAAGLTGGLKDGVVVSTITVLIGTLGPLSSKVGQLERVNKAMDLVVDFVRDFAVISTSLAALSAGQVIANGVTGLLGLFGVKSPMEQLAEGSAVMVGTLERMILNFERLTSFGSGRLAAVTSAMSDILVFMRDYAKLAVAIEGLPGAGAFEQITDNVLGFFGADSPAERLAAQSAQVAGAITQILGNFEGATAIRQRNTNLSVTPAQIDSVVQAAVEAQGADQIHDDLMEQNALLREMLRVMQEKFTTRPSAPEPTGVQQGPRRTASGFTREVAGFGY